MLYFLLLATLLHVISAKPEGKDATVINVVGGDIIDITKVPYQARLENAEGLMCGASIVTNYHVLTASKCIEFVKGPITVHTGTSLLSDPGTVHHIIANYTMGIGSPVNLAVLRLKETIVFNEFRQPIKIVNSQGEPRSGLIGRVAGWGYTDPKELSISNELRAVEVPIVRRDDCNRVYNDTLIGPITDGEICAGNLFEGGKDTCRGDAGSALVINGLQVGIASRGYGCGESRAPGIYTNIAYYADWIVEQLGK